MYRISREYSLLHTDTSRGYLRATVRRLLGAVHRNHRLRADSTRPRATSGVRAHHKKSRHQQTLAPRRENASQRLSETPVQNALRTLLQTRNATAQVTHIPHGGALALGYSNCTRTQMYSEPTQDTHMCTTWMSTFVLPHVRVTRCRTTEFVSLHADTSRSRTMRVVQHVPTTYVLRRSRQTHAPLATQKHDA